MEISRGSEKMWMASDAKITPVCAELPGSDSLDLYTSDYIVIHSCITAIVLETDDK